ncbi:MAG: arginyltransferase [Acidobacteriota bacterium]
MSPTEQAHARRTLLLAQAIERAVPAPGEPFPCPYLSGRTARNTTLLVSSYLPGVYHSLMDLNFRRLGHLFYRPRCDGCDACRMIRVPVEEFRPSRAQRRCWTRNRDLSVELGQPVLTDEKHELYGRYLSLRHDGTMDGSLQEFQRFLYTSSVETVEVVCRAGEKLVAVSVADLEPLAMSAVYCYFEPYLPSRSLGTFNILWMIEECRRRRLPYLYLGFFVRDCHQMRYKSNFLPCEILTPEGRWIRPGSSDTLSAS